MNMSSEGRSERVDLRMSPTVKQTLLQAAAASNKTLTEFLLDSGMHAAHDTLADRRTFVLNDEQWADFMTVLDSPPADNPRFRALLHRTPAWEP